MEIKKNNKHCWVKDVDKLKVQLRCNTISQALKISPITALQFSDDGDSMTQLQTHKCST